MKGKRIILALFMVAFLLPFLWSAHGEAITEEALNDIDSPGEPPEGTLTPRPDYPVNSPSMQETILNPDGSYTFRQRIDQYSTPPHWEPAKYIGEFGLYSWYNEDYGWMHDFPQWNEAVLVIQSATITIRAWDVDSEPSHGYWGEYDGVHMDGVLLQPGYLQGRNNQWSVTTFNIPVPNVIDDGKMNVWLNIDMHHDYDNWATTVDYSLLEIKYTLGGTANNPPWQPVLSISPQIVVYDSDNLVALVVGPPVPDKDGDSVSYQYRWLVDPGTGAFIDDEFAGRGDHTGNTVPASATRAGDKWRVQVIPVDEHGAIGPLATATWPIVLANGTAPFVDMEIDKWGPRWASPWQTITYGIKYRNTGTVEAHDITIIDDLPTEVEYVSSTGGTYDSSLHQVTFSAGTANPGKWYYLSVTVRVKTGVSGSFTNDADVSTIDFESNLSNNGDSWTVSTLSPHDPNEKHVLPAGDISPGQTLTYTVECENVGTGIAFGVYVTDELDEDLDDSTLNLFGRGTYDASQRLITWYVGDLDPAAGDSFTFEIKVKSGIPDGTVVSNYATVYFPSVAEETRTNIVTNTVDRIEGDLDNDRDVDLTDRGILLGALRKCTGTPGFIPEADYDHDGCITFFDYQAWYRYYQDYLNP